MTYLNKTNIAAFFLLALYASALAIFMNPINSEAILLGQVRKSADQTVSGDVLQNDSELLIPLVKNRTYIIDGTLFASKTSAGCFFAFTVPTGATMRIGIVSDGAIPGGANVLTESGMIASDVDCSGNTALDMVQVSGTVQMGNTDGNLQLQTMSGLVGESVTVSLGSWLRADKL